MTNSQTTRFNKILKIIINSNINSNIDSNVNIISEDKLKEYIKFCIVNDLGERIKYKTSYHHILPRAKTLPFKQYSKLKDNPWNGTYLTFYNHYYAHFLLTQAVNEYAVNYAFTMMHKEDVEKGRISEDELISEDEYNKIFTQALINRKEKMNKEFINEDGELTTKYKENGKKTKETKLKEFINEDGEVTTIAKEIGKKQSITKNKEFINEEGKLTTRSKEIGEKCSKTKLKEFINEDGEVTNIYKENAKKAKETRLKEFINEDGEVTTRAKEIGKKCSKTKLWKAKRYDIYDKNDILVLVDVSQNDICNNYSQSLLRASKEKRLGGTQRSKQNLKHFNKEYLIGWYVVEKKSFRDREEK